MAAIRLPIQKGLKLDSYNPLKLLARPAGFGSRRRKAGFRCAQPAAFGFEVRLYGNSRIIT